MTEQSAGTVILSSGPDAGSNGKEFPLGTPCGAGPLIGWVHAPRPAVDSTELETLADGSYCLAGTAGVPFDGLDSGFLGANSGRPIRLFSEGNLVVGREGTDGNPGPADAGGPVALAIGLDPQCRLSFGYYKRVRHPDTSNPRDMAGRLMGLIQVVREAAPIDAALATAPVAVDEPDAVTVPTERAGPSARLDGTVVTRIADGIDEPLQAEVSERDVAPHATDAAPEVPGRARRPLAEVLRDKRTRLAQIFTGTAIPALSADSGMRHSIRRHLHIAVAAMILLVGGVGGWAATTELSGAVIAMGQLVVDSNVQKVQHPFGGVVAALNVRDGDQVAAGEVLIRLDGTETRASLAIVVKALDELYARQARGAALRDGASGITFPADLLARRSDPEVAALLEGEERLFNTMLAAANGQKAQFQEQVAQLDEQVRGMEKQLQAKEKEIDWNSQELVGIRELWEKKLVDFARVTGAERDGARLEGEHGLLLSSIAEAKGKIAEIELRILQVDEDVRTEMGKELAEIRSRIAELVEKKTAGEDQLQRLDIRAPQAGIVHELALHTIGGVIRAGDTIMGIVPDSAGLTAEVKVPPQEIDQLYVGQAAVLRFLAFNQQTTPVLNARVDVVSADVTADEKTGATYYTVRVSVPEGEIARLEGSRLIPGMPVEVHVQTNPRTVMSYLIKPLSDQVGRAFRER